MVSYLSHEVANLQLTISDNTLEVSNLMKFYKVDMQCILHTGKYM